MLIELRWPPDGLAGVVDDEIQPVPGLQQVMAEGLDAGCVPEIEPEDLEPVAPFGEVGLPGVPSGRVAGKPGGDDEVGARPEQFDPGLKADLDPAAGQQRHPARQIGQFRPLPEIERRTHRAELVVEVVDGGIVPLAGVAVLRFGRFPEVGILDRLLGKSNRREIIGRGEDLLPAELADPGIGQNGLDPLDLGVPAFHPFGLDHPPAGERIGAGHHAGGAEQADLGLGVEFGQHGPVFHQQFEEFEGSADTVGERGGLGQGFIVHTWGQT